MDAAVSAHLIWGTAANQPSRQVAADQSRGHPFVFDHGQYIARIRRELKMDFVHKSADQIKAQSTLTAILESSVNIGLGHT